VEVSDHDIQSEDINYSHISESDNEEEQEDAIEKKQTSFNHVAPTANTAVEASSSPTATEEGAKSPPKAGQSKSQPNDQIAPAMIAAAFNQSTEGSVTSDPYDKVKPISKKSFEEDTTDKQGSSTTEEPSANTAHQEKYQ
jgi:hypothetical protein